MSEKILVLAPHPDDETLGCGGTLLRLAESGAQLAWVIVTSISEENGFAARRVHSRDAEIDKVAELYKFTKVFRLSHPTRQLDLVPMSDLIEQLSEAFRAFLPTQVFLPNQSDVHSDHRVVFDAGAACTKWFRNPSVRRVLSYETISETDFSLDMRLPFQPNYYVDIAKQLERKLEIMSVYQSEIAQFPFPRSLEAIRALAVYRGSTAGFPAAEAFALLRERF